MKITEAVAVNVFVAMLQISSATSFKVNSDDIKTLKSRTPSSKAALIKEVPPPPPPPFPFEDLLFPSMPVVAKDPGLHSDVLRRIRRDTRERDHWGKPKNDPSNERRYSSSAGYSVPYVNRRLSRRRQRVRQNQRGVGYDYEDKPTWLG